MKADFVVRGPNDQRLIVEMKDTDQLTYEKALAELAAITKLREHQSLKETHLYLVEWARANNRFQTVFKSIAFSERKTRMTRDRWDLAAASILAHVLPRNAREEWLGDLLEARYGLITNGSRPSVVSAITLGRIILLLWSFVSIKYSDLVSPSKKRARQ